ncbi:MAG: hypothetical protein LUD76_10060 [Alistipes sp.]|nr:hypothetical protein [Alistipes sp.]
MKRAVVKFKADGTMTLVHGRKRKRFDTLSRLVNYCRDNNIEAWPESARE